MRVIIMETNGKEAVALGRDGQFIRIRNTGYAVGQEVQITPDMIIRSSDKGRSRTVTRIAAIAACFCVLFVSLIGFLILSSQSFGYVSVDVNPSIEYHINRFDRVISVSAANADGEALLQSIGIEHMEGEDIEVALALTVSELSVQGYLDGENAGVIISSSADSERMSSALNKKLKAYAASEEKLSGVEVVTAVVPPETVTEAERLGITAGKLYLIQSISADVNIQEWIDRSVTVIYAAVQEHSSELPADPETDVEPPSEITAEPDTPAVTEEPTAPETEPEITTEDSEVPTETEPESEQETQTEAPTEPEVTEELTWPETWPEERPSEWPEEWPEPETDENGNVIVPEPEEKPWWWWIWELLFGKHD